LSAQDRAELRQRIVHRHADRTRAVTRGTVECGEGMHPRWPVDERVSHAIWDRELGRQPVVDRVEVSGLARNGMYGDGELRVAKAPIALPHLRGGVDRRVRAETARMQLDPVLADSAPRVTVGLPGVYSRPLGAEHAFETERPVERSAVHLRPSLRQQRALNAGGRGQPDLDRLAVGPERATGPAGT